MLTGLPPFYNENTNTMYTSILKNEVNFPSYISANARSLINILLNKDDQKRADYSKIVDHPFFADIDWEKLYNREITPPFVPQLKGADDDQYFDEEFTNETVRDSIATIPSDSHAAKGFVGFTFTSESVLNK